MKVNLSKEDRTLLRDALVAYIDALSEHLHTKYQEDFRREIARADELAYRLHLPKNPVITP